MSGVVRNCRLVAKGVRGKGRKKWGGTTFIPIPTAEETKPEPPTKCDKTGWTNKSRRAGLLMRKVGMIADFDEWGAVRAMTVLKLGDECEVVQVKQNHTDGYVGLQLGAGKRKLKRTRATLQGHFARAGVLPKQILQEFRVSEDAIIPVGTKLDVQHFLVGQYVDCIGVTKGKGFAGVMKRWNFSGGNASHGASKSHRSAGSTGQSQDPGRVFKNKKMAGHMGHRRCTVKNLKIYKIMPEENALVVVGSVPGPKKSWLRVRDSLFKPLPRIPPFPTFIKGETQLDAMAGKTAVFPRPHQISEEDA